MRQEAARRRLDSMDLAAAADAAADAADDPDEARRALPFFRRHQRSLCMYFGSINLCRHRHRRCKITQTRCWAPRSSAWIVNGLLFGKSALLSACTVETVHTTPAYLVVNTLPGNPANVQSASGRARLADSFAAWKRVSQYALKPLVDQDAPGAGLSCCLAIERGKLHSQL